MAVPVGPAQDPLFFAEEFTARRRRYIPVNVNVTKIATTPQYKNYGFPFIFTERKAESPLLYPELFGEALGSRFKQVSRDTYTPTTKFEAYTIGLYEILCSSKGDADKKNSLEKIKDAFVLSLVTPGSLVDLQSIQGVPMAPSDPKSLFSSTNPSPFPTSQTYQQELGVNIPSAGNRQLIIDELQERIYYGNDLLEKKSVQSNTNIADFLIRLGSIILKISQTYLTYAKQYKTSQELNKIISDIYENIFLVLNYPKNTVFNVTSYPIMNEISLKIGKGWNVAISKTFIRPQIQANKFAEISRIAGDIIENDYLSIDNKRDNFEKIMNDLVELRRKLENLENTKIISKGTLTPDFYNYITSIDGTKDICKDVLFHDTSTNPSTDMIDVDMAAFISSILPENFDRSKAFEKYKSFQTSNFTHECTIASPTEPTRKAYDIESAYRILKNIGGSPTERYLKFISFLYFFFDHIPVAQTVISTLLIPIVGMINGIIYRGMRYAQPPSYLLDPNIKNIISDNTLFVNAQNSLYKRSVKLSECAENVVKMFRNHRITYNAFKLIISGKESITELGYISEDFNMIIPSDENKDKLSEIIIEILKLRDNDITVNDKTLKSLEQIYQNSSLSDFDLPSSSSDTPNMIPRLFNFPDNSLESLIFSLVTKWYNTDSDYQTAVNKIDENQILRKEYEDKSIGRVAYEQSAISTVVIPKGIKILESPYENLERFTIDSLLTYFGFYITKGDIPEIVRLFRNKLRINPNAPISNVITNLLRITPNLLTVMKNDALMNTTPVGAFIELYSPEYNLVEPWKPNQIFSGMKETSLYLPRSFQELLYQGMISHYICDPYAYQLVTKTLVHPVKIENNITIVFARDIDISGGYVIADNIDLNDVNIRASLFEFPTQFLDIKSSTNIVPANFTNYPHEQRVISSVDSVKVIRKNKATSIPTYNPQENGTIEHKMTDMLDLSIVMERISAKSKIIMNENVRRTAISFADLPNRTKYAWTTFWYDSPTDWLEIKKEPGKTIFFPAFDIDLFLMSLIDVRLQVYYLSKLSRHLISRNNYADSKTKIDNALGLLPDGLKKITEDNKKNNLESSNYIKSRMIINLTNENRFRNLLFGLGSETSPVELSKFIKETTIDIDNLSKDVLEYHASHQDDLKRKIIYDIDLDFYISLLTDRQGQIKDLGKDVEDSTAKKIRRENEERRELEIVELINTTNTTMTDEYSRVVNELITRSCFKLE